MSERIIKEDKARYEGGYPGYDKKSNGSLCLTDKHIIFKTKKFSFEIPIERLESLEGIEKKEISMKKIVAGVALAPFTFGASLILIAWRDKVRKIVVGFTDEKGETRTPIFDVGKHYDEWKNQINDLVKVKEQVAKSIEPLNTEQKLNETITKLIKRVSELEERFKLLEKDNSFFINQIYAQQNQIKKLKKLSVSMICRLLEIQYLYYLTDIRNLDSILLNGIMCKNLVFSKGINHFSFADENIQRRRSTAIIGSKNAHDYVPLYFHFKPPMLYRLQKTHESPIIYICIDPQIIVEDGVWFTDKNLACSDAKIFNDIERLLSLRWDVIKDTNNFDPEARNIRGAEVLIPEKVLPYWFQKIVVPNSTVKQTVNQKLLENTTGLRIPVEENPKYYY